ncbi:DNA-directed RNA polymerase specialized sigma24 family protein [Saccharothrix tamanrassetensis]|uniref:DNA-directed RNA polymerase specialized sigma24 family protein n=1 Tax=Saccharothrix tamanrassetensis TaxID=1051531 RepID=A0A841CHQ8_9PSEU|nr:sigma factor-like helix-turn-helix DNA-binding protein [Saccharothrix tamanrassetensis]MBB5956839.1 DNA-directed RNA polymerase specialized sigma24 family protein [Saccharothrix tamanrassetensis]
MRRIVLLFLLLAACSGPEPERPRPGPLFDDEGAAEVTCLRLVAADMRRAMGRLRREQYELLVLAYLRGIPYREPPARLKVPIGTVKSRIRPALQVLRAQLARDRES